MSILSVKNLSYAYDGENNVLKDVNISFDAQKTYAIVGKSGSGKTTLISLLSGLDKKQSGEIYLNDQEISNYDIDEYRASEVGIIFQRYNLLNNFTVLDNILMAMRIAGQEVSTTKAIELLERVGLEEQMKDSLPLNLSGGQQQRVAIARTLAKNCKVIIADEPTGNLDEETELDILRLLKDLADNEGKSVIIVTHSNVIAKSAEHVFSITNGVVNSIK
ncbi:ABC transporter ATP-binding protein [Mollicutes bacterium LVI A0039]|nr:ABC transporter ATP-binding protein [Mollicutes bacterium LVI A0039]